MDVLSLWRHTLLLTLFLCSFRGHSQQYNFHNYSVKDGIAQSQVYSLLQDSRGYLWMGTRGGGLSRFDGTAFKTYSQKDGLLNNYVFCLLEDSLHNLWIGTNNGLSYYNGISFRNLRLAGDSGQTWVQEMAFDQQGRLWLATNNGLQLLEKNGRIRNMSDTLSLPRAVINALHVDRQGQIWFGTADGLFQIAEHNGHFRMTKFGKAQGFMNNAITVIREDAGGKLWIGTYGDGAYVYNGKRFYRIDQNQELYKQTVLCIYFDTHNNVWMGTLSSGVARYDVTAKTFSWLSEAEGLSNNHVRSILQDNSGNYWFGTSGGGVCNYFGKQFTQYDKSSGLGGNFIYSIFRDSRHRLWIGTSDKGLSVLDSAHFKNFNASNGFLDTKVKAIAEDNEGLLYFGTDGQGVYTYNGLEFSELKGLSRKYIRAIVKDRDGAIWIATAGMGLYKWMPSSEGKSRLINFTTEDGLLHNRLTALHYDKLGRLWYGTESNGIGYLKDDHVVTVSYGVKEGLASNTIRSFAEDASGYLWVGTAGSGISSFPLYQGSFRIRSYNHTQGLTSSNVYLLSVDKANHLFVGTETGLDYLVLDKDRKISDIKHYGKGEGFTGIETCQNAVFNDPDGSIWFGTINGLSNYNPANLVRNTHPPVTTITDVRLFYEPLASTGFHQFSGDWNTVQHLQLPYEQNHLSFDFLGINYSNPEAVRYQWKLLGFDPDWSPLSQQRTVTYSNLSPGTYTFLIKACNEDGIWNPVPASVSFIISPPIWQRWWFITLMVLLLGGLVIAIFKWRINRVKAKAREMQRQLQMEKEIVELEQKALRLQMNPHFIFNALNSIQSQIGTNNEQSARYYLAKFSRLMRQILDHSRQAMISLEEEISILENYLLIEQFCNDNRFDYSIEVDPQLEKDYVKIPPMLLQPFVENAIKHGLKWMDGKRGRIEVHFREAAGLLECSVTDNGIGRQKSEELSKASREPKHTSVALEVTRERLELFGTNNERSSMEITDLYDPEGKPSGTQVILRIPIV